MESTWMNGDGDKEGARGNSQDLGLADWEDIN